MITTKDFLAAANYKITGGAEFMWSCYGPDARFVDCDSDDTATAMYSSSIIFDSVTQVVYEAQVHDNIKGKAYRLMNPDYVTAHIAECQQRNIPHEIAYDDVRFIDLEVDEDFLEKLAAIVAGEDYEDIIQVPLNLPNDILMALMLEAHRRDITLNALVTEILQDAVDRAMQGNLK